MKAMETKYFLMHAKARGQSEQSEEVEELVGVRLETGNTNSDACRGQQ